MGVGKGSGKPIPEFPDPGLIDALADKWLAEGDGLEHLADVLRDAFTGMDWTGDAHGAAGMAAFGC
jgi:hypothetical protein